jgi:hypothetical protein
MFRRMLLVRVAEREGAATAPTISWPRGAPVPQSTNGTAGWQHFVAAWSRVSWTAMAQSTRGDPRQPQLHLPRARKRLRTTTATPAFSVSSRPWSSPPVGRRCRLLPVLGGYSYPRAPGR